MNDDKQASLQAKGSETTGSYATSYLLYAQF